MLQLIEGVCASGECQPKLVPPLTSGNGFQSGLTVTEALHSMLLQHIDSALGSTATSYLRGLPGEDYKSIVPPDSDGKPRTRVAFLNPEQKHEVVKVIQPMVESWVGQKLQPSSVYGVRLCVFHNHTSRHLSYAVPTCSMSVPVAL